MKLRLQFTLLTLCIFVWQTQWVACVRPLKENSRTKLKCFKNVTTSPESQTQTINPKCITLSHPYCLDIKLPYNSVALLDSFSDLNLKTFEDVQSFLDKWRSAQKLPTCWPILQVALCSLMMPKCEEDPLTGRAIQYHQASVDICNDLINYNKTNCRFIQRQLVEEWPSLFTCSDTNLYAKNCTNELRDLRYSLGATSKHICQYPLVPSSDNQSWFRDIEGCALHCKFPISNPHDQASISLVIKTMCLIGLASTILAIILDKVNDASNKSSRFVRVTKRCTICQLLIYIGWSLQILLNQEVGCKSDGSLLYGQPLVANSCILSFLLTYLPSLSSLFWSAHLGKLCHEKLTGEDKSPSGASRLDSALSLFNYGIPLTLFVSVAFLGHIDGHGLYGICTVGQQSVIIKTIFIFVPSVIGTIYGNYFFARIIIKLAFVKTTVAKPLHRDLMRISALVTLTMLQTILSIVNYIYESRNQQEWLRSIEHYVGCQLNLYNIDNLGYHELAREQQECVVHSKPLITLYYLEILSTLATGIVISSWAFCESNFKGLRRKLIDVLEDDKDRQRRAELNELYLDVTSPKRVAGGREARASGSDDSMSEDNDDANDQQVGIPLNRAGGSGARISRRASLQSVTLTSLSIYNSENSSVVSGYIPMNRTKKTSRHYKGSNKRGKTSRDVVNDCKQQRVSNQQQNLVSQEANLQQDIVAQAAINQMIREMQTMRQQFNPPDLSKLQMDPVKQPRFNHGFAAFQRESDTLSAKNFVNDAL